MLNRFATNMAQTYYTNCDEPYDEGDIEVYAYGLEIFLSSVLEVFATLLLGLFMGKFFETIAFFAAFIPLRSLAGGYHAKTNLRCFAGLLVIYAIFLGILYFTPIEIMSYMALAFALISALPVLILAPLPDKNKPIGPIQRVTLRKQSVIVYCVQAVIIVGFALNGWLPHIV